MCLPIRLYPGSRLRFSGVCQRGSALEWYHKAKHLRDERASRYLGLHYANGTCGLDINRRKARELFLDGASLGLLPARRKPAGLPLRGITAPGRICIRLIAYAARPQKPETPPECFCWHITIFCGPRRRKTEKKIWKRALEWAKKAKAAGGNAEALLEEAQKRLENSEKRRGKNMACSVGNASKIYFSLPKREKCTILSFVLRNHSERKRL